MKKKLRTILALFRLRFSEAAIYRLSFFTGFFVDTTVFVTQLIFLELLAGNTHGEWSRDMYAMFIGSFMTLDGVYMVTWFFGVVALPDQVRSGSLDLALIKPLNPLFYISFNQPSIGSVPIIIVGLIITMSAAASAGCLTLVNVLLWLVAMTLMYVLMYSLTLIIRVVSFWTKSVGALDAIEGTLVDSAMRLPLPAIRGAARFALLLALPYGMVGNFPALALSGNCNIMSFVYALILTVAFFALAMLFWRKGLRRYESASS